MAKIKMIRILQHDTEDQIRIGMAMPSESLDQTEKEVKAEYEQRTAWCGGFKAACEKYYKRIAIVDADTLEVIRVLYTKNK